MSLKLRRNGEDREQQWAFHDNRSGADVVLYYRNPTTQEHVAWRVAAWGQQDKPAPERVFFASLEAGMKILTGFREGDIDFGEGERPENWIARLAEERPDIIADFASFVFTGAQRREGTDAIPFEKSLKS